MTTTEPQQPASVSFELFPPEPGKGVAALGRTVERLAESEISGFDIYTLNKPEVTQAICRALGLPITEGQRDAA